MTDVSQIRAQVERIAESEGFRGSPLMSRFLRYTVDQALEGNLDALKETVLGVEVCGRTKFDPRYDSVVRTTASRLRSKLSDFYAANPGEPIRIEYLRGGYVPQFLTRPPEEAAPPVVEMTPEAASGGWRKFAIAGGVAGFLALAILAWWAFRPSLSGGGKGPPGITRKFQVNLPAGLQAGPLINTGPSRISPDGSMLAIALRETDGGDYAIWIHHFASGEWRKLSPPGIRATHPFWSPDSREVAGVTPRELWRIRVDGSNPQMVTELLSLGSAAWSETGQILLTNRAELGLQVVPASGGKPAQITRLAKPDETWHAWPAFLPGGDRFFYTVIHADMSKSTVYLSSLSKPSERNAILNTSSSVAYYPANGADGGYLVYQGARSLMAIRYDARKQATDGEPVAIAPSVSMDVVRGAADMSVASDGALATRHGEAQQRRKLLLLDAKGRILESSATEELFRFPSLSPDGKQIATGIIDLATGIESIWIFDRKLRNPRKFSGGTQSEASPAWSPDGSSIAFIRGGNVCVGPATGIGQVQQLTNTPEPKITSSWSPDGKLIFYTEYRPDGSQDVMRIEARPGAKPEPVITTPASETEAQVSPDGKFIAYESEVRGQRHVYVERYPVDPNHRDPVQLSTWTSYSPHWVGNGSTLAFVTYANRRLMTVALPSRATQSVYETPVWFHRGYGLDCRPGIDYCVVSAPGSEPTAFTLNLLLHPPWPGLNRR